MRSNFWPSSNPEILILAVFVCAVAPATSLRLTRSGGRREAAGTVAKRESQAAAVALNETGLPGWKYQSVIADIVYYDRAAGRPTTVRFLAVLKVWSLKAAKLMKNFNTWAENIVGIYHDLKVEHSVEDLEVQGRKGRKLIFKSAGVEVMRFELVPSNSVILRDAESAATLGQRMANWGRRRLVELLEAQATAS